MPLTDKGEKIKDAMQEHYGAEKGERVFYASANKGTIKGVDEGEAKDCGEEDSKVAQLVDDNVGTMGTPAAAAAPDAFGGLQQGITVVPELMQKIDQMTQRIHMLASRVDQLGRGHR